MRALAEIEQERQREQARLDQRMGLAERNRTGQFATPPSLALEIAEYARRLWQGSSEKVRFLEPCVGTGAFYSALLQTFSADQIACAAGYESDPGHATVARSLWRRAGLEIEQADFLQQSPPDRRFDLLITNPPYVRHHHLTGEDKRRLQGAVQDTLGIKISGLAGLYCYFMLLSHRWVEEGGLSLWLVPSEFMDVNYGSAVKRYLLERVTLLHVHRYCPLDGQFQDALVSSAVVVFRKSAAPDNHAVTFSLGGSLLVPERVSTVPLRKLRPKEKWTKIPTAEGRTAGKQPSITLGDLFTIKRGLATGDNRFFILPRAEAARRGIPERFLRPVLPSPRRLPDSIIEAEADGYPRLGPQLALLDCSLSEDEIRRQFPDFWRYLESGKAAQVHTGYLASRRTPWYAQESRPAPPFLCTYMGRANNGRKPFRFLWNKSQATAHNVYLLLYPKGELQRALNTDPGLCAPIFAALREIDTGRFIGAGRVYGGGLYKMEPKELSQVNADGVLAALDGRGARVRDEGQGV
jgi:predicted RNA methylase